MKPLGVLLLGWLITGAGALAGSILGNAFGSTGLKAGAVLGGLAGIGAAVSLSRRLGWLAGAESRGALLGGVIGFALAVPLTLLNMGTPLVPVASCALVGAGILLGAGVARGTSRTR